MPITSTSKTSSDPLIEAHRGDRANAPENTLAAFSRAIDLGADSIELDVRLSLDGVPVVIHDDRVDRTTNGSGPVEGLTCEELRRLDAGSWFSPRFTGERIPLLAEVVDLLAGRDMLLNVELKSDGRIEDLAAATLDVLTPRLKRQEPTVVSSFDEQLIAAVLERVDTGAVPAALIGDAHRILPAARRLGIGWIHAEYHSAAPDVIRAAHAAGLKVTVWTVNEPWTYVEWVRRGVDKLCTDCPARFLAAAGRRPSH